MTPTIDVDAQLDELRAAIATLQGAINAKPRLSLVAVESAPYLGQSAGLTLTVMDRADSIPMPGVPVTLVTSWGVLRGKDDPIEGTSVATSTGSDGVVRVTLRPHPSIEDNEDQDAIEAMLALLDPAAATPQDALKDLQTLAQQYRWEANQGFRNAVDAYFRDFGQGVLDGGPFRDYMGSWLRVPATVIALVPETDNNTSVAAVVTVEFRDWLGAWLQVYNGVANPQTQLGTDFKFVQQQASSAAGLIAAVFDRTAILVDNEFGQVGKKVAQQAAQRALDDFVSTGLSDLSVDLRATVGPVLTTGARALITAGESVVAAIGQTHAVAAGAAINLSDKVGRADLTAALAVKANAGDLQTLQSTVATKADRTALDGLQASLAAKADLSALQTFQSQTNTALGAKANASDLQTLQSTIASKVDSTALDGLRASLAAKADLSALQTFQSQTNTALGAKANASDLQTLQSTIASKADRTALDGKANAADLQNLQATVNAKADKSVADTLQASIATKADQSAFQTFQSQTTDALSGKAAVADLKTLQTAVASKVDQSALTAFQDQTTRALAAKADQAALQNFQTQVGVLLGGKVNVADLQAVQAAIATKADQSTVTAFQDQTTAALAGKAEASTFTAFQNQTTVALQSKVDTNTFTGLQRRLVVIEGKVR